ncbi:DUF4232 domain-containing protein [Actinoplanes sp. NPDC051513]|uniref:DUF4232 domain-containing protein n=1 Tax=Actinoplanes sp. NPDC051513 TaxID=3363908 RepID=UPI0037B47A73
MSRNTSGARIREVGLICASTSPAPAPATTAPPPVTAAPTTPPPASAGEAGGETGTPRCHTADLKVSIGQGEGAAGTLYTALVFKNATKHACTLFGYPGVSWVAGNDGHQVNVPFTRNSVDTKSTVTLKPGAVAHATLATHDVGFFDAAKCKPVDVRGFRVYPSNETRAVFVALPTQVCSVNGIDAGSVTTITEGASS